MKKLVKELLLNFTELRHKIFPVVQYTAAMFCSKVISGASATNKVQLINEQ